MKILQIFGWVVGAHLVAFLVIFGSPGCSSSPRNVPTPDATAPSVAGSSAGVPYSAGAIETLPPADHTVYVPEGTPGRVAPTRPGSPNAAAITPAKATAANVSPVTSYTIQKGDSLAGIATRCLGKAARWKELAQLNQIKDPASLKVGQILLIPGPVMVVRAQG